MIVKTLSEIGTPICPMCENDVDIEGEFCDPACWEQFHRIIQDMGHPLIEMNYLDLTEQPWYGKHHG